MGQQAEVLEDHREPPPAQLAQALGRSALRDVLAVEQDLAGGRLDEPGHAPDQRGLAAAGQAHHDEDLAGPDVEADVAEGDRRAVSSRRSSSRDRSASGVPMTLCSAGPKTFHRFRTLRVGVPGPRRWLAVRRSGARRRSCRRRHPGLPSEPAGRPRCRVLPDVLGLTVLVETGRAELPADPGALEAAPFCLRQVRVVVVDPDRPVRAAGRRPAGRATASLVQTAPARP